MVLKWTYISRYARYIKASVLTTRLYFSVIGIMFILSLSTLVVSYFVTVNRLEETQNLLQEIAMHTNKVRHNFLQQKALKKLSAKYNDEYLRQLFTEISFFKGERKIIDLMATSEAYMKLPIIKRRLDQLNKFASQVRWRKKVLDRRSHFVENIHALEQPIFLSSENVKEILSSVEGLLIDSYKPRPKRPNLLFKSFELSMSPQNNSYKVNMQVLERLYSQSKDPS